MKLRRYVPPYKQDGKSDDCGPTCVRMVINSLLPKQKGLSRNSYSGRKTKEALKEIIRANGLHFVESSWENEKNSLRFLREAIRKNRPVILSCRSHFGRYGRDSHYIVLKGIDKKHLYVSDPYPKKPTKINIDEFIVNTTLTKHSETRWGRSRWGIAIFE